MHLPQLTFTRFLAATAVILFHSRAREVFAGTPLHPLIGASNHFVSYFFVLSGFILVISTWKPPAPDPFAVVPERFWQNRLARLYPMYLLALLLYIVATQESYFGLPLLSTVLLVQAWIPPYSVLLNPPGWSLSVEALFYALFPVLLPVLVRQSTARLLGVALVGWAVNTVLFIGMIQSTIDYRFTQYFPLFHLPTFVFGVCLGLVFIRHRDWLRERRRVLGLLTVTALALTTWGLGTGTSLLFFNNNGLLAPVYALGILSLSLDEGRVARTLSAPGLVLLGEISYGMYLLHAPISAIVRKVNAATWNLADEPRFLIYFGLIMVTAWLCHEFVEKPSRRYLRAFFAERAARRVQSRA